MMLTALRSTLCPPRMCRYSFCTVVGEPLEPSATTFEVKGRFALFCLMFSTLNSKPRSGGSIPPASSSVVPSTTAPAPSPKMIAVSGSE